MGESRNLADRQNTESSKIVPSRLTSLVELQKNLGQGQKSNDRAPAPAPAEKSAPSTREELTRAVSHTFKSENERITFIADISRFAERSRGKLSSQEINQTYAQVLRLINGKGVVADNDRLAAARFIMHNAAHPTDIDQGNHNTCNVTALECRLYARTPSHAAKAITDMLLSGQFVSKDGTEVKLLSHAPDKEAMRGTSGSRNYASQIFQMTAANVYWNRQESMPDGKTPGKGKIFFAQGSGSSSDSTGDYLLDTSTNPPRRHSFKTITTDNPHLGLSELADINEQITGCRDTDFAVRKGLSDRTLGIIGVTSTQSLKDELVRLKAENKFPVLLQVDAAVKPFGKGDELTSQHAPHAVTIVDYDSAKARVWVDNQYGTSDDFLGLPGTKQPIPADELYRAMRTYPPFGRIASQVATNIKNIDGSDIYRASTAGLSTALLWSSISGSTANVLRGGLNEMRMAGSTSAGSLLRSCESASGRALLRGGTTLGALGTVIIANDLHKAFKEGTEHGVAKLTRVGLTSVSFELGTSAGLTIAKTLGCGAKGKFGLAVGAGMLLATIYDAGIGDGIEVLASTVYRKATGR